MISPLRSGLFLLAAFLGLCSSAEAQHMNAAGAPCQKAGAVVTALANCFDARYRADDEQMNRLYKQIRQVLKADQQQQLLAAQRLWLQLRDATCKAESDLYQGGALASPVYSACLEGETRQRSADLKTIYGWVIANSK